MTKRIQIPQKQQETVQDELKEVPKPGQNANSTSLTGMYSTMDAMSDLSSHLMPIAEKNAHDLKQEQINKRSINDLTFEELSKKNGYVRNWMSNVTMADFAGMSENVSWSIIGSWVL